MKTIEEMTITELEAFICSYLSHNGIECVLTGGTRVVHYSGSKYQSFDIDFIETSFNQRKLIVELMNKNGFFEENRYFVNEKTKYFVEFPTGPLAIGSQPIHEFNTIEFQTGALKLLTATDCVNDRLAAFYFWDDNSCLEQAILVALSNEISLSNIKDWSIKENYYEKYNFFLKELKKE